MKKQLIVGTLVALMLPMFAWAQEDSNAGRRKSLKSDNPQNSRSTSSKKDSAKAMTKGDMNNKKGATVKPASKKMAKNRADD